MAFDCVAVYGPLLLAQSCCQLLASRLLVRDEHGVWNKRSLVFHMIHLLTVLHTRDIFLDLYMLLVLVVDPDGSISTWIVPGQLETMHFSQGLLFFGEWPASKGIYVTDLFLVAANSPSCSCCRIWPWPSFR